MKKLTILLLFMTQVIWANNLNITNVNKISDTELSFDISWDNSWNSNGYHDAVWIFVKAKDNTGNWIHVDITSVSGVGLSTSAVPTDQKGFLVMRQTTGAGTVNGTINFNFANTGLGPFPDFKVFGIEMVYINEGAFYVGDGNSTYNEFHQGDNIALPYYIQNSNEITVGNTNNDLNANNLTTNIPATYPTGYDAFYLMKYEITQEQYVAFLNTLTVAQQQSRTETDLSAITSSNRYVMSNSNTPNQRNGIACNANATNTNPIVFYCDLNNNEVPNEANDGQNIACNYLSADDTLAYLDWAAMRPMTDLEYEKAARGPVYPIAGDLANGTTTFVAPISITNSGQVDESVSNIGANGLVNFYSSSGVSNPIRVGAFATSSSNRLQSGGSFYGVMDLTGNLYEFVVRTGDGVFGNHSFTYSYGDGSLTTNGFYDAWSFNFLDRKGGAFNSSIVTYVSARFWHNNATQSIRTSPGNTRGCR
jgi:formylglycine-generating enzyme required for sulfatase activity